MQGQCFLTASMDINRGLLQEKNAGGLQFIALSFGHSNQN